MRPPLEAVSITVRMGRNVLLDDISLSFERGRIVALIGPNGAGKSTLLRVLSGDLKPQSGQVRLDGREIASYAPDVLALHRAVLPQKINIAFPFTVAEVARMGVGRQRGAPIEPLIDAALAELDLYDLVERVVTTLSGGEQQRVHFARVLAQLAYGQSHGGSGILLLDEPTAGLDLRHQLAMLDAIKRRAAQGALVVGVFHDLNLAALCADHVIVLDHGRIDSEGRPDATITGRMLERVFGIATIVGQVPVPGMPFVLPQAMAVVRPLSASS